MSAEVSPPRGGLPAVRRSRSCHAVSQVSQAVKRSLPVPVTLVVLDDPHQFVRLTPKQLRRAFGADINFENDPGWLAAGAKQELDKVIYSGMQPTALTKTDLEMSHDFQNRLLNYREAFNMELLLDMQTGGSNLLVIAVMAEFCKTLCKNAIPEGPLYAVSCLNPHLSGNDCADFTVAIGLKLVQKHLVVLEPPRQTAKLTQSRDKNNRKLLKQHVACGNDLVIDLSPVEMTSSPGQRVAPLPLPVL